MTHQHDHDRLQRIGMPEAVLCGTKTIEQVAAIVGELAATTTEPRLFTRLGDDQLAALDPEVVERLDDDRLSRTALLNGTLARRPGQVVVVAAGASVDVDDPSKHQHEWADFGHGISFSSKLL